MNALWLFPCTICLVATLASWKITYEEWKNQSQDNYNTNSITDFFFVSCVVTAFSAIVTGIIANTVNGK